MIERITEDWEKYRNTYHSWLVFNKDKGKIVILFDPNDGVAQLSGKPNFTGLMIFSIEFSSKKRWFLNGEESTASEVWETLSEEDKAETLWELEKWR